MQFFKVIEVRSKTLKINMALITISFSFYRGHIEIMFFVQLIKEYYGTVMCTKVFHRRTIKIYFTY